MGDGPDGDTGDTGVAGMSEEIGKSGGHAVYLEETGDAPCRQVAFVVGLWEL